MGSSQTQHGRTLKIGHEVRKRRQRQRLESGRNGGSLCAPHTEKKKAPRKEMSGSKDYNLLITRKEKEATVLLVRCLSSEE